MELSMQDSPETQAILRRMEEVRCDLDEAAQEIAESARDLGEWRHYVKNYPWISVGIACTIGYVTVPRRRVSFREVNRSLDELVDHSRLQTKTNPRSTGSIHSSVLKLAGNLLWRSALSFATRKSVQYFAAHSVKLPSEEQA